MQEGAGVSAIVCYAVEMCKNQLLAATVSDQRSGHFAYWCEGGTAVALGQVVNSLWRNQQRLRIASSYL